ncbi:MAG: glutamate--tRNA ligase [Bacteroidia bacterium]|nr:MAG: glutamate--tRNA ligase [Bacteroidia bacterium]
MNKKNIRVRFAPSPTGPLHIGGLRTALFNYLFAQKNKGTFILRIEDTDQLRYVPGAEEYIKESLKWCGIKINEGQEEGGKFGPYKQSERKDIYRQYIQKLIDAQHAYYAFDTPEELDAMRKELEMQKSSVRHYNALTRSRMKNSFTLSPSEVEERIKRGDPYVVRFKMPENESLLIHDLIRGEIKVHTSTLDDKVLFKSDGMPTYHLANIVDDHLMQISHVIRGEEWLPSLPLHVLLYRSFGWENQMPQFAHLPLILKPSGKGKLSKRDGDQAGFPVFPLDWKDPVSGDIFPGYREAGYLPEAFLNLLAMLGWNPGTEQEVMTPDELIKNFDLEKVQKGGARFSPDKAKWFNQQHIKQIETSILSKLIIADLEKKGKHFEDLLYLEKITAMVRDRMTFIGDFWEQAQFFFETPKTYNPKMAKKHFKTGTETILQEISNLLEQIHFDKFTSQHTEEIIKAHIEKNKLSFGKILNPLRLALTGTGGGPHIFDILESLGKSESLKRIHLAVDFIQES